MGFVVKVSGKKENYERERMYFEIAADHVIDGRLIAFPTDSVYGLGGDPSNLDVCERLYTIKFRSKSKGFLLLVADIEEAKKVANFNQLAEKLSQKFWPGELTLILNKKKSSFIIPPEVTGNQETIRLRVPKNPVILSILNYLKQKGKFGGIIGTSANFSEEPPSTSGKQVAKIFSRMIYYIIDSGKTESGVATTIVDCTEGDINILRKGKISKEELEESIK
ncbi:MAG: L-threonylcarbamoyladenylate synthase [Promethearchaeia archaeon]